MPTEAKHPSASLKSTGTKFIVLGYVALAFVAWATLMVARAIPDLVANPNPGAAEYFGILGPIVGPFALLVALLLSIGYVLRGIGQVATSQPRDEDGHVDLG
ncbi:MAG: hypothetical protein R2695_12810 [Acidimicrobiales bacterium]